MATRSGSVEEMDAETQRIMRTGSWQDTVDRAMGTVDTSRRHQPPAPEPVIEDEFAESERDAHARIEELEQKRRGLLVDTADTDDPDVARRTLAEVAEAEEEIRACERVLVRTSIIRVERERRAEETRAAEAAQARAEALEVAQQLGEERHRAACEVDAAAVALAKALAVHRDLVGKQNVQLEAAGRRVIDNHYRMVQRAFEHSLARAFGDEGVRALIDLPLLQIREVMPFADGDPAPRFGG